jgi:hypothetical protein
MSALIRTSPNCGEAMIRNKVYREYTIINTIDGATYTVYNAGNRTAKTDQRTAVPPASDTTGWLPALAY